MDAFPKFPHIRGFCRKQKKKRVGVRVPNSALVYVGRRHPTILFNFLGGTPTWVPMLEWYKFPHTNHHIENSARAVDGDPGICNRMQGANADSDTSWSARYPSLKVQTRSGRAQLTASSVAK
jgi:hypothetical protein